MKTILLLGAGFSKNWGGWLSKEVFEYLLGCEDIQNNKQLLNLLWAHQEKGFEELLSTLNNEHQRYQSQDSLNQIKIFENAIKEMFKTMNDGFFQITNWDNNLQLTRNFLTRFDAIFSLNQDLLLERHYLNSNIQLASHASKQWGGFQIPGMRKINPLEPNAADTFFVPDEMDNFKLENRLQPFIKLHGSSNWSTTIGQRLLILGGNKVNQISQFEILNWYFKLFEDNLNEECRLMIVGYGFNDDHINKIIMNAAENNLKIFVISPDGPDQALRMNKPKNEGGIYAPTDIEELFKSSLIGASRAPIRESFSGANSAEYKKISKFFEIITA